MIPRMGEKLAWKVGNGCDQGTLNSIKLHRQQKCTVLGFGLVLCMQMLNSEPQVLVATVEQILTYTKRCCVNLAHQCKAIG